MTLKWSAAIFFGAQLILVTGGVVVLLLLQTIQQSAVASADSARQAEGLEADYFAGMTEAQSSLQQYLYSGDSAHLIAYHHGLAETESAGSSLRLINADPTERFRVDQMFAEADAWKRYAARTLSPLQYQTPAQSGGDEVFASYTMAERWSTDYLETLVIKAGSAEALASSRETLGLAAIGVIAVVSAIAGGALNYRSTVQPLGRLIRAARQLAAGARTELPSSISTGEIGDLSRALGAWQRSSEKRIAVGDAMHEVSGRIDRDEIVRLALERLVEVSDATVVALVMLGDTETAITTLTVGKSVEAARKAPDSMQALLNSGATVSGDLRDNQWPDELRRWASMQGLGPLLLVPLISGSKSVGSVAATRAIGRPPFDTVDIGLVEAIATPLAAAIRVAGLFEQVRAVSAQLDIVNRHKTDFLSNMSHELRTPLNSILGFADLLVTPGFDPVTAKQARYIANIHASGTHLTSLIDDALDLAKVESGKAELQLERIDVRELVEEVVATVQPLAIAAQVNLVVSPGRKDAIVADRRKLHQVLLNLLSNAIKFTPSDGVVTVHARRTSEALLLTVVDTGIGVAAEDHERIFGAFEQVTGANRDGGGTGLGLALARQYVELHGGRLWLESEIGRGSTFHISLPDTGASELPADSFEVSNGHRPLAEVVQTAAR